MDTRKMNHYTLTPVSVLRCRLTAEVLANIYSHVHEDTDEKVRRAHAIANEIIKQEMLTSESKNTELAKTLFEAQEGKARES